MCGIAGIAGVPPGGCDPLRDVASMVGRLVHRGPDGVGAWDNGTDVWLGHRRLAIIDVSATGAQPMESALHTLVFNGEIYNYVELRGELEKLGATFRGTSDTEVLLSGFDLWGVEATVDRAVGMFAFAAWDRNDHVLTLVRDRLGKKPLYYWSDGRCIAFASELKSLAALPWLRSGIDSQSVSDYLSIGTIVGPRTIYDSISEVMPGHIATFPRTGGLASRKYWSVPDRSVHSGGAAARTDRIDHLDELLGEATRIRLRSDVPVGVFLSGGIDSGVLGALAARGVDRLATFTVSFPGHDVDEAAPASAVARHLGTDHETLTIESSIEELLGEVAAAFDEPHGDPAALPTFAIARAAAHHVTVVLNGEGGDELFGGYRRHRAAALCDRLPGARTAATQRAAATLARLLPAAGRSRGGVAFAARFARGMASSSDAQRYLAWSADGFTEEEKQSIFAPLFSGTHRCASSLDMLGAHRRGVAAAEAFLAWDLDIALPDGLLVKLDMATMAHSIEARCPFLDHRVVEWACSLAISDLLTGSGTKPLLRALAARYLPEDVVHAPKKGFEIPVRSLLAGPLAPTLRDVCLDPGGIVARIAEPGEMRRFLDCGASRQGQWEKRAWLLLMLGLWERHADRVRSS